jgi:hypothetical protein
MVLRLFLSFIAGIVLLAAAAPAQAQNAPLAVELRGRAHGGAWIVAGEVTLELEGLAPAAEHVVHVHAGTVEQPSASFGLLGRFTADAQGRGRLRVTRAELSATGARLDLSAEWLADGTRLIDVHAPDGAVVASGAIPAAPRAPTQLPRAGGSPWTLPAGVGLALTAAALLRRGAAARFLQRGLPEVEQWRVK